MFERVVDVHLSNWKSAVGHRRLARALFSLLSLFDFVMLYSITT